MKTGIVGSGFVGATAAYALVMRGVGRRVVLVDMNRARASAEADDILHAVPFAHQLEVTVGDYADLADCKVVVVSAGVGQKPGETRLELLGRNAKVFEQVIPNILKYAPNAILLIATNPVDVMTHIAAYYAGQLGVPSSRVIGTGTTLDTARLRTLLGRRLKVDSHHIHAYVLGEHGDSEVLPWSLVTVGGIPLDEFCTGLEISICPDDYAEIDERVRRAAYHIIEGKGATYYGIGSAIARIVEVIQQDERSILTVCTSMPDVAGVKNVTVSLPNLIGGEGIIQTFYPNLSPQEMDALRTSAQVVRSAIDAL
ncbi:MAG: L-lactate dehydrogenase, partial [Anaerolineales bacterium]|nr:L-lactate dehydrogenase [Anaerolineales bacterium]